MEQYQRLCKDIETRGVKRSSELTRQQARRLQAFMALDEDEPRDLLPLAFTKHDRKQTKKIFEATAEKLRESADPPRNPFLEAAPWGEDTILVGEREVRDRDGANRSD